MMISIANDSKRKGENIVEDGRTSDEFNDEERRTAFATPAACRSLEAGTLFFSPFFQMKNICWWW